MARKKTIVDRRERIIHTADQLFNHFGYDKTTMEDISRDAGIPRATLYLDFPGGKEDILMASIANYLNGALLNMRDIARRSTTSRLETLKQVILYFVLSTYDRATSHRCDPNNTERHRKRVRDEMASFFKARTVLFAEILQQAAMAGEISLSQDGQRIAELVSQGLFSFLPPLSTQHPRETVLRDADAFFSLLLSGLIKTSRRQMSVIS